ncbi:MAG: hypothetical protein KY437_07795, partial [Actinobacteria bacterium]|nr:hypothetical protein [Actinomycetota bacterium]
VIWLTTTVSGADGVLSDDAQAAIGSYLDDGGALWLASARAAGYLTTDDPEWLASYFGFEVDQNLLNAMGEVQGQGDEIGGDRTIAVNYLDGRPYIDYGAALEEGVTGTATGLFAHAERPEQFVATKVEGDGGFRSVYGLPVGVIEDGAEQMQLTREVLSFLGVETGAPSPSSLDIHYQRYQHVQVGEDWPVTVGAVAPADVGRVSVGYRPYGADEWDRVDLEEAVDGIWTGTIPGSDIANNGLEYFVEADVGGNVVEVDGGSAMPHVASAPYGDPAADARYCGAAPAPPTDDEVAPAPQPLPTTGGGIGLAALALLLAAASMRRGRPLRT